MRSLELQTIIRIFILDTASNHKKVPELSRTPVANTQPWHGFTYLIVIRWQDLQKLLEAKFGRLEEGTPWSIYPAR